MIKVILILGIGLVTFLRATNLWAGAQSGLGLFAGFSSSTLTSGSVEVDTSGPSLGIDYQFAIRDDFSVAVFSNVSAEEGEITRSGKKIPVDPVNFYTFLGVEGRKWYDNVFFGLHFGFYRLDFIFTGIQRVTGDEEGLGIGVVGGWEGESGFFIVAQLDNAVLKEGGDEVDGFRVQIGFRFKGDDATGGGEDR